MSRASDPVPPWTLIFSPQLLLSLLAKGATTKQIAEQLRVKEYWVEEALAACRAYFGVTTRSELVAIATKTVPRRRSAPLPNLSAREREIVELVATGIPDKQIARELDIAIGTVRTHLDRTKKKTGLRRRAEIAAAYANANATPEDRLIIPRSWEPYLQARLDARLQRWGEYIEARFKPFPAAAHGSPLRRLSQHFIQASNDRFTTLYYQPPRDPMDGDIRLTRFSSDPSGRERHSVADHHRQL